MVWKNIYSFNRETQLREFQWKLLHRLLPCNKYLFYWKKVDSMHCNLCHVTDSLEHRYLFCDIARTLWAKITNIICRFLDKNMRLENVDIIFNSFSGISFHTKLEEKIVKNIVLIGKWSIHKYWISDRKIPIRVIFKHEFVMRYKIEKELEKSGEILELIEKIINLM